MKRLPTIILMFTLIIGFSASAQNATLWGVGDDYEIDYLHSGRYLLDGEERIKFKDQPSTEFNIMNVTNDVYDYSYIGYGGIQTSGTIRMQSYSFGGFISLTIPTGEMPVMLPLSYGEEDDWISSFANKLNELSNIDSDNQFLNGNISITDERFHVDFKLKSDGSLSMEDTIFQLPSLEIDEFEGSNITMANSTLFGNVSYELSTGVLFSLNTTINADTLFVDDTPMGSANISQSLEFVAIIPPVSVLNGLPIEFGVILLILIIFPTIKIIRENLY